MRKKYLSALLFGAVLATATGTFVSCKDYDDDIDNLQEQITANSDAIKKLQELVGDGKWLKGVTKNGHDLVFSVSDGSTVTVASVDGKDGNDGNNGTIITMDPETKNWIIDGNDTGVCAQGKDGLPGTNGTGTPGAAGKDGKSPKIGENGNWFVWDAEKEEWVDTKVSTDAKNYVVDKGLYYELHMQVKDSEELATINLPATAVISGIKVLNSNYASGASEITLNYGKAGKDVEFNGKSYKKNQLLFGNGSNVLVQLNPTNVEANKYEFELLNSKGESSFVLGEAKAHETDGPITRAKSADKGLFNIPVSLKEGLDKTPATDVLYAVATKDYQGNQLLSDYSVTVKLATVTTSVNGKDKEVELGTPAVLAGFLEGAGTAVDYYFEIPEGETANKNNLGVTIEDGKISATKTGSISVICKYLKVDGTTDEASFKVTFIPAKTTGDLSDFNWTVTAEAGKNTVSVDASGLLAYFSAYADNKEVDMSEKTTFEYANASDKDKYEDDAETGIDGLTFKKETDKYGYTTLKATLEFNPSKVAPTTFKGTLKLDRNGNLAEKTVNFTVTVNANGSFDFKPLDAYFNADKTEATAYGKPNADGDLIIYDLYNLFKIDEADKSNISFAETIPASYKKDNVEIKAQPWLDKSGEYTKTSTISVKRADAEGLHKEDGVNSQREITVKYVPFGNDKIEAITKTFKVTVVSEVAKGEFKYVNWTAVKDKDDVQSVGKTKEINGEVGATLELREVLAADVYGKNLFTYADLKKSVKSMDSRIEKITVELADDNAKEYLAIDKSELSTTANDKNPQPQIVKISKKSVNTAIVTPPTCTVAVKILDKWGVTTTVNVQVKVNK